MPDNGNQIISLKEARKLLGVDSSRLSDNDLLRIIQSIQLIANDILDSTIVPNNDEVDDGR